MLSTTLLGAIAEIDAYVLLMPTDSLLRADVAALRAHLAAVVAGSL